MTDETKEDFTNDPQVTTNTQARWELLGSILAALMVVSLPVVVLAAGAGLLTLGAITQGWFILYATVALMAATWAFGTDTLKAVREAQNDGTDK